MLELHKFDASLGKGESHLIMVYNLQLKTPLR